GVLFRSGRGQRHVVGLAVAADDRVGPGRGGAAGLGHGAPDAGGVVGVLPAGDREAAEVLQHGKSGVVVQPARPRVTGTDQFLEGVLAALVERADRRLVDDVGAV